MSSFLEALDEVVTGLETLLHGLGILIVYALLVVGGLLLLYGFSDFVGRTGSR